MKIWKILYTIFAVTGGTLILLDLGNIIVLTQNANLFLGGFLLIFGFILQIIQGKQKDKEEDEAHTEEKIKERDRYFENEYSAEKNE
ncbi:hypothetical protein ATL39_0438 [Sinobaca qinghaiensis]|uniref:Uncharacterized protein n=1 Tax=Sinobaca qinghaiensis TaxID=342944 RepID=A0A419V822_9BACL|nr:hypothetical protein [Sinobaca qinghaiensis]RKD76225.1 hypothetical protein ATL39_0438 [Sinobaca qinghaiensis]